MTIKRILVSCCTITLLFMMFHDITGQAPTKSGYGELCKDDENSNITCDDGKNLTCNNITHICGCEPDLYYESLRQECVSVVGGNCSTNVTPPKCIADSVCNNESKCECKEGFLPSNLRQCLLGYNELCSNSQDCSDLSFLTCKRGRCDCMNDETQTWNKEDKRCSILLNKPCNTDVSSPPCVTHAECNNETSTCICENGFVPDSDRCAADYNGTCTNNDDCSGLFLCNNVTKTCGCDNTTEIYDAIGNVCLVMVEESCGRNTHCVNGAHCQDDQICRCNSQHLPNPKNNKTCSPVYEGECGDEGEGQGDICTTFPEYSLQCNPSTNKCLCKAQYEHNIIDGKCHGSLNAPCTNISVCHDYAQCSNNGNDSKCLCKNEFTLSPHEDECLLKYNDACGNATDLKCNIYEFLTCSGTGSSRCLCENPTNMTFQQKCVALAESVCMTTEVEYRHLTCITNATCQPTNSSTGVMNGICNCNEGFTQDENKMCTVPSSSSNSINAGIGILLLIFFACINV